MKIEGIIKRHKDMEEFLKNDIGNVSASQQHIDRAWLIQRVEELEEGRETWKALANGRGERLKELESQLAKKNKALEPFVYFYNNSDVIEELEKEAKEKDRKVYPEKHVAYSADREYDKIALCYDNFRQASEAYDG